MRIQVLVAATLVAACLPVAAQSLKPGLWEIHNKMNNPEADKAMAEMQKQLAAMPPVQRKQVEAAMAQQGVNMPRAGAGGGMVTVKVSGDLEVREIRIDPEAVDPEDVELLQDMVLAAVNEAVRSAQELAATKMNAAAGGLAGPGGLGGLGLPGF